jgi:arabinogalactan endo-1,4-beta-galactosidase
MEFAKKFKKLAQDVDEYAVKFDDFAKAQKDAWDKRVTELGREIRDLNAKLVE